MTGITALVGRWQRLEMHVRCGLSPEEPALIQMYVHLGLKITRRGDGPALAVHLRMLGVLLRSGEDPGLPRAWRSACLEHASLPLAQVTSACRLHDPVAVDAVESALQRAWHRLPEAPSKQGA